MPFVDITMKRGMDNDKIVRCMKDLTDVIANTLENVKPLMVRISVIEVDEAYIRADNQSMEERFCPVMQFQLGPGREHESIMKCMDLMIDTVHKDFGIPKDEIRLYMNMIEGDQLAIGGKLKVFGGDKKGT